MGSRVPAFVVAAYAAERILVYIQAFQMTSQAFQMTSRGP